MKLKAIVDCRLVDVGYLVIQSPAYCPHSASSCNRHAQQKLRSNSGGMARVKPLLGGILVAYQPLHALDAAAKVRSPQPHLPGPGLVRASIESPSPAGLTGNPLLTLHLPFSLRRPNACLLLIVTPLNDCSNLLLVPLVLSSQLSRINDPVS
jgi:hypothetical protein